MLYVKFARKFMFSPSSDLDIQSIDSMVVNHGASLKIKEARGLVNARHVKQDDLIEAIGLVTPDVSNKMILYRWVLFL